MNAEHDCDSHPEIVIQDGEGNTLDNVRFKDVAAKFGGLYIVVLCTSIICFAGYGLSAKWMTAGEATALIALALGCPAFIRSLTAQTDKLHEQNEKIREAQVKTRVDVRKQARDLKHATDKQTEVLTKRIDAAKPTPRKPKGK